MQTRRAGLSSLVLIALVGCDRVATLAEAQPPIQTPVALPVTGDAAIGAPLRMALSSFGPDVARDVVVLLAAQKEAVILANNGSGTLVEKGRIALVATPVSVAAVDVDDDGDADLAIACKAPNTVKILINDGSGGMTLSGTREIALPGEPVRLVAQQLDDIAHGPVGDVPLGARIDLLVGVQLALAPTRGAVVIYHNQGDGKFVAAQTVVASPGTGGTPILDDVDSGDIDNDKDIDIIFTAGAGRDSTIRVLANSGAAGGWTLKEAARIPVTSDKGAVMIKRARIAELNGDASVDLLITGQHMETNGPVTISLAALNGGGAGPSWTGFQGAQQLAGTDKAEVVAGAVYSGLPWFKADLLAIRTGGPNQLVAFRNETDLSVIPPKFVIVQKDTKDLGNNPPGVGGVLTELNGATGVELLLSTKYFKKQ